MAMLVDNEFILYADSSLSLLVDSAIIVLVMGTVPFVKKPRMMARAETTAIDGASARIANEMKMQSSQ